jgi:hypothetical protein
MLIACWRDQDGTHHIEFYSKNKFEKLVHLVGFIIRILHECSLIDIIIPEGTHDLPLLVQGH